MSRQALIRQVRKEVEAGKDRAQVFADYQSQFKRPQVLANAIAWVARPERKSRYRILNYALLVLVILGGLTKIAFILMVIAEKGQSNGLSVAIPFSLLMTAAFAYYIYQMNGQIYGMLMVLAFANVGLILARGLPALEQDKGLSYSIYVREVAPDLVFVALIAALSWYLKTKLFPNLKVMSVKQDAQGQFLL